MGIPLNFLNPPGIAGVDVRDGSWDLITADLIRTQNTGSHEKVVRPTFIGKVADEHQVLFVLRQMKVRFAVVDCMPEATLAGRLQEAAKQHYINVWRSRYNTFPNAIEMTFNEKEELLSLDRTQTLTRVHTAFKFGTNVVLPQNFKYLSNGSFVKEMTTSIKVLTKWHGRDVYAWENSGPDHSFHAFNLLLVALRHSGLDAGFGQALPMSEPGIVESTIDANLYDETESFIEV